MSVLRIKNKTKHDRKKHVLIIRYRRGAWCVYSHSFAEVTQVHGYVTYVLLTSTM